MKTIKTIIWTLLVTLTVSGSAIAQNASFFQNKMASAVIYSPTLNEQGKVIGGAKLQAILDQLAEAHGFTYILVNGASEQILTATEIHGKFPNQPLNERLTKIFSKITPPTTITFNRNVLLISRAGVTTTASATPTAASPAPVAERESVFPRRTVSDGNNSDNEPRLENSTPVPQYESIDPRNYDYRQVQPQRVMNPQRDASVFVPAAPSWTSPWSEDYYSWNVYVPRIGYAGTKVSPRDAQDPFFWNRINGNRGFGGSVYNQGAFTPFWGGGAYWGYDQNQLYRMYNRNPEFLNSYGMIKINGPDALLRKVRVLVDGLDVTVGSKANNKWNQPIVVPSGERELKFIYEGKEGVATVTRKIHVPPAAAHLSLTGNIKPMDFRISANEFDYAQNAQQDKRETPVNP